MARTALIVAQLLILLLAFESTIAATYSVDLIWPETGTTGATLTSYKQWRAAAELAAIDINAEWATSFAGNTFSINYLDNANNAATSMNHVQTSSASAIVGAGSDAMTESAALAVQSAAVRAPQTTHSFLFPTTSFPTA
jgi:hypothetical protein